MSGALERERHHHDRLAAGLDPSAMPPTPPDEWERELLDRAGDVAGRRVLELGCGDGGLSLALLERGAELTAVDLSPAMVDVARARAERFVPDASARFLVAQAEELPFADDAFDLAIGKWVLHHFDLERAAPELARVLRPGARGIFSETSGLNPLLVLARRRLAGHAGIARCGTPDERPMGRGDLRLLARHFARVRAVFPNFWLAQMLDRHVLAWRRPALTPLLRRADEALARALPRVRPYGHWMLVELER